MKKRIERLDIFGDSIMKGVTFSAEHNRYKLCNLDYSAIEAMNITLENHSRMGSTIDKGLEMIDYALPQLWEGGERLAIIEFGGNDCNFDWKQVAENPNGDFLPFTPEEQFVKMFMRAINVVKQTGANVAVATLVPLDSEKFFRHITKGLNAEAVLSWLGDEHMLGRWQEHYNNLALCAARKTGTQVIDIRGEFLKRRNYRQLLCEDGIHPTQKGYDIIVNKITSDIINRYKTEETQRKTG